MNLKKRTMDEMITHFNKVVSEMNIPRKYKMTLLGMITAIGYEAQNAADVAPVTHGRWISDHPTRRGDVVRVDPDGCPVESCHCSVCGDWLTASDEYPVIGRYCPNCGALMDKDGDGDV